MRIGLLCALLLAALGLSACGGDADVRTVTVTETVEVAAAPAEDAAEEEPAEEEPAEEEPAEEEPAEEEPAEEESVPGRKIVRTGESATVDGIAFKLDSFERVDQIATGEFSDGPILPKPGSSLYEAVVTWRNKGQTSADIFCGGGSAALVDEKDRNFDSDSSSAIEIPDNTLCSENVQPGMLATATLVFHAPRAARPIALVLWNGDVSTPPGDPHVVVALDR